MVQFYFFYFHIVLLINDRLIELSTKQHNTINFAVLSRLGDLASPKPSYAKARALRRSLANGLYIGCSLLC